MITSVEGGKLKKSSGCGQEDTAWEGEMRDFHS